MLVDELRHPNCRDCDGDGYTWSADDPDAEGTPCERCAGNGIIERDLGRHPEAEVRPEWRCAVG
jgi:DnaJ-class molecular chaperone